MDEGQNRNGGMSGGSFSSLNNPNSGQSAGNAPFNNVQPMGGNAFGNRTVGGTGFSSFSNNAQGFGSGFGSNMNATGAGVPKPGMISSVPDSVDGGGDNKKRNKVFAIIAAVAVLALIVGVSVIAATGGNFGGSGGSSGGSTANDSGKKDDDNGKNDDKNTNNDVEEIVISDEINTDYISLLKYGLRKNNSIDESDSHTWYFRYLIYSGISEPVDTNYFSTLKKSYEDYWNNIDSDEYKIYNQYFSAYCFFANRNSVLTAIDGLEENSKEEYLDSMMNAEQYSSIFNAMIEAEKKYFLNDEREKQLNRIMNYIDLTWDKFAEITNSLKNKGSDNA